MTEVSTNAQGSIPAAAAQESLLVRYLRCWQSGPSIMLVHFVKLAGFMCIGVWLPLYARLTYDANAAQGDYPVCNDPLAPWLRTIGTWGLLFGGSLAALTVATMPSMVLLQILQWRAYAAAGGDSVRMTEAPLAIGEHVRREMRDHPTSLTSRMLQLAAVAEASKGCCYLPAVTFGLVWAVKGHLLLSSGIASTRVADSGAPPLREPLESFNEGCGASLHENAQKVALALDVVMGSWLCVFCFGVSMFYYSCVTCCFTCFRRRPTAGYEEEEEEEGEEDYRPVPPSSAGHPSSMV